MTTLKDRNESYWRKRFEEKEKSRNKESKRYCKELKKEYRKAFVSIQEDIAVFYSKYAKDNGLTLVEARKLLDRAESTIKAEQLEQAIKKIINGDSELLKEVNKILARKRLTRFEGLQADIITELAKLENTLQGTMTDYLSETFNSEYLETMYEIHRGIGMATSFSRVPTALVEQTLAYPWSGDTYSNRIWGNNSKLANLLKRELTQGFIKGESIPKISKRLSVKMERSYKDAVRLVNTEASFICNAASIESYKACDIEQYEFLATLDDRTSQICGDMDGMRFDVDKAVTGENLPPMHVNCRSTTVPYFDDAYDSRIARIGKKQYVIPGNMSYAEWLKQYGADGSKLTKNKAGQTLNKETGEVID